MKKNYPVIKVFVLLLLFALPGVFAFAQFTQGNLALFVATSATSNNTTGSVVEINTINSSQTAINTFAIPASTVTLTNQLRFSGSATSTGYLSNSNDGTLVCFSGSNTINTTSNVNTQQSKGVGTFDGNGVYALQTTYTGSGTNQARSASTLNNTNWFIGDQGGFYTNGATVASPTTNTRSIKAFGGTVYGFTASATAAPVFTISGTTGAVYASLPGLPNGNTSRQDFYLVASGSNGTAYDVLYILDATSATAGTIFKYSLVSGNWVANGTYTTTFGGFGMAAKKAGTGAELFVSSGTGATATNSVIKLTDAAGFNAAIAITTASNLTLYTAPTGSVVKGITFAPAAVTLPTVNLSVSSNSGSEAAATSITVTATASAPVGGNQTVALAVSGAGITNSDYSLSGTTITIPNGQTTGTVTFLVRNDAELEGTETATLMISAPSAGIILGTTTSQNISISDNSCQPLIRKSTSTSVNGAEISAFDPSSNRLYTVAGTVVEYYTINNGGVLSSPTNVPFGFISTGNNIVPNSLAIKNGVLAIGYAIVDVATGAQQLGVVAFYNSATGAYISQVNVGYLPDMIIFSPDGTKVLAANEGEPNSYGQGNSFDPEGSISIIDISGGVGTPTVQTAGFTAFNAQMASLKAAGVRIYGPGATVAQDLEPEYISFSGDGLKAFVTLQENNAIAELDIATATVTQILPLGLKNHNLAGNGLDASDQDGPGGTKLINIQTWPIYGMYMPDAIASFKIGGATYYITANEGDSRAYTGYTEEVRVGAASYVLDPTVFPNASTLKQAANLGRLQLSNATGDTDGDGDFDEIHALGARSFSIWNSSFTRIFDSGDQLEQISSTENPNGFNSDGTVATFDTRSDNKGPEPEAVTTGMVDGVLYAFVGSERTGDIFVYDITNPAAPVFKQYIDNPLDLQVEGLLFVPANESPTGKALIISCAEVSRTVSVYEFSLVPNSLATTNTSITTTQGTSTNFGDCNGLIARVNQAGANPIAGTVNTKVWIEPTVLSQNSQPFVQRHFEIAPILNAATATGRVTLYLTQSEFDNFNADPLSALDLPSGPTDVTGISNLLVIKYPGTSSNGTGLPESYTGAPSIINPTDADIVYNTAAARWEISFDVTGFSGFFVQTSSPVLPLTLLSWSAQNIGANVKAQWKSVHERNHAYYEIEYSIDGRNFMSIGQQNASGNGVEKNYQFTHLNAANISKKIFYRLKMVANNGSFSYSNIIIIRFTDAGVTISDVYPNPSKGLINVVSTGGLTINKPVQLRVSDASGRLILTKQISSDGSHTIDLNKAPNGIYLLQAVFADGSQQQFKIIRQ
jgi:uncharacterized protein